MYVYMYFYLYGFFNRFFLRVNFLFPTFLLIKNDIIIKRKIKYSFPISECKTCGHRLFIKYLNEIKYISFI